jgi:D-galactarolactone isomerase
MAWPKWPQITAKGGYADTKIGPPTYADSTVVEQTYAKAAPERCVWGSDWPHPSKRAQRPGDAVLFDLLLEWTPDAKARHRILVENQAVLYDYPRSA